MRIKFIFPIAVFAILVLATIAGAVWLNLQEQVPSQVDASPIRSQPEVLQPVFAAGHPASLPGYEKYASDALFCSGGESLGAPVQFPFGED